MKFAAIFLAWPQVAIFGILLQISLSYGSIRERGETNGIQEMVREIGLVVNPCPERGDGKPEWGKNRPPPKCWPRAPTGSAARDSGQCM